MLIRKGARRAFWSKYNPFEPNGHVPWKQKSSFWGLENFNDATCHTATGAEMVARCTFYSLVIALNLPGEGGIPVHRIKPRVNIGRLSRTHAHFLQFCQPFSKQEWVIGWVAEEVKRVKRKAPANWV
ncbi:Uncharacterized protein TCM_021600 isoform 1 [Theobroma cacao]|uniref:Uncharacterized protein isoform 1 n=1 Tax=Theobroma cacao TaxID=3641 RepID=A0A061EQF5_THECC|nr:Uncharacterized protein TCM_021600 isoform 1 [Theobroma cacao]EOY07081.1 Uncharacterized protein TCM_021600 isoform 1 [Theobroma cacao]EOY07082.1 Uncharacterized protein TCM_021600 isoform 1 [Theobroma cacao]